MGTFYPENDFRNYLSHARRKTLRDHRLEQVRKTINTEDMTQEHEDRIRREQQNRARNHRHQETDHDEMTEQERRNQVINNYNREREDKIRREREFQEHQALERDRISRRNAELQQRLSDVKPLNTAKHNNRSLRKVYNTKKPIRR